MPRPINFSIEKTFPNLLARAGVLHTSHGNVETPAFVAVATKATVKGIASEVLKKVGVQCVIANTYHLYLSPGEKLIEKAGGIHSFMNWDKPIMTDSGGFQVFSLGVGYGKKISKFVPTTPSSEANRSATEDTTAFVPNIFNEEFATSHGKLAIVDEDGVTFTSHNDGSLHRFTPERSIEIQHALGADIIYAFDECTSPLADYAYQKEAADRTHRWATRSLAAHRRNVEKNNVQGIYGIVQGGRFADLRIESAKTIGTMDFDGYGVGGSFSKEDILGILDQVHAHLPQEKPRHLLGIAEPEDLFIGVAAGVDTFDCVLPTRNGRTGGVYTHQGKILIENAKYKDDFSTLDPDCYCVVCARSTIGYGGYTKAYIHHLFRTKEMLAPLLVSEHNIYFLTHLLKRIRQSILQGTFIEFKDAFLKKYGKA